MAVLTSPSLSVAGTSEDACHKVDLVHDKLKAFDVGLVLVANADDEEPVSAAESKRIRRKTDLFLAPMLGLIFTIQWIDKSTLSASSILGLIADNDLTGTQFNSAGSAFFVGYLISQWPQSFALQRLPVGKWLTFNIFLWSVFLGMHALSQNFATLFTLRFLLGTVEGCMNAGLMLVCSMFYTRNEVSERIGWAYLCNGVAQIISGFLQFGAAHLSTNRHPNQWQWFMIITSLVTFSCSVLFLFCFPDNPLNARFLTPAERVLAVRRVRENQNGIETKVWKRYQLVEALRDPKCLLYFFFMAFTLLEGGVAVQYSLIIKDFGFTEIQTALLAIPSGCSQIILILVAGYAVRRLPNCRGWISMASWIPGLINCLLQILVPIKFRTVHLIGIFLQYLSVQPQSKSTSAKPNFFGAKGSWMGAKRTPADLLPEPL